MERLQQAITVTQQAVGQLQGMFKRLASKMETDVKALGQAYERLTEAHNALVDEVAELRAELRKRPQPKSASRSASAGAGASAPVAPPTIEVIARQPPSQPPPPEPEDAVWFEGNEDEP